MRLLKPWKRKVAAKIQPSYPLNKDLEKELSDSEDTARLSLWDSDSTLSYRESISGSLRSDTEVKALVETATETTPEPKKTVSFDSVETREYGLIVGDSEDVVDGFPLMLDWCHSEGVTMSVDEHEDQAKTLGRGPMEELDAHQRRLRLRAMGFTEGQLRLAERRRRVQTTLDWAYGQNKQNTPPFLNKSFVNNYIK